MKVIVISYMVLPIAIVNVFEKYLLLVFWKHLFENSKESIWSFWNSKLKCVPWPTFWILKGPKSELASTSCYVMLNNEEYIVRVAAMARRLANSKYMYVVSTECFPMTMYIFRSPLQSIIPLSKQLAYSILRH